MNSKIRISILNELAAAPEGISIKEKSLLASVALDYPKPPTDAELRAAIKSLQTDRYISGATHPLDGETRWQITPNGRIALDTI